MGVKHIHRVEKMSIDSGWELLCKRTYLEEEEEDARSLRSVGVQIVNKCGGLLLAIKVIAGVLNTKEKSRKEWEKVLRSNAWSMSELPEEFRGALYLSYDNLPPHLKQCFLSFTLRIIYTAFGIFARCGWQRGCQARRRFNDGRVSRPILLRANT
uniref:Uncharacterized protein n=1 Tax=Ananas comosus var. bracteatus TaxID=296719 RepID=A0A6V7QKK7_ANACO|nr:unnamed protein product [Ananas comosus var. bracteatus]